MGERVYYHTLHIRKWIIEQYFIEIYPNHKGNNRYLVPNEELKIRMVEDGIDEHFCLIGYSSTNGNRRKIDNDLYVIVDEFTEDEGLGKLDNMLCVNDIFLDANRSKVNENYVHEGMTGIMLHSAIMSIKNKEYDASKYIIHHICNTFDNRFRNIITMIQGDHLKLHRLEEKLGIKREKHLDVTTLEELMKIIQ